MSGFLAAAYGLMGGGGGSGVADAPAGAAPPPRRSARQAGHAALTIEETAAASAAALSGGAAPQGVVGAVAAPGAVSAALQDAAPLVAPAPSAALSAADAARDEREQEQHQKLKARVAELAAAARKAAEEAAAAALLLDASAAQLAATREQAEKRKREEDSAAQTEEAAKKARADQGAAPQTVAQLRVAKLQAELVAAKLEAATAAAPAAAAARAAATGGDGADSDVEDTTPTRRSQQGESVTSVRPALPVGAKTYAQTSVTLGQTHSPAVLVVVEAGRLFPDISIMKHFLQRADHLHRWMSQLVTGARPGRGSGAASAAPRVVTLAPAASVGGGGRVAYVGALAPRVQLGTKLYNGEHFILQYTTAGSGRHRAMAVEVDVFTEYVVCERMEGTGSDGTFATRVVMRMCEDSGVGTAWADRGDPPRDVFALTAANPYDDAFGFSQGLEAAVRHVCESSWLDGLEAAAMARELYAGMAFLVAVQRLDWAAQGLAPRERHVLLWARLAEGVVSDVIEFTTRSANLLATAQFGRLTAAMLSPRGGGGVMAAAAQAAAPFGRRGGRGRAGAPAPGPGPRAALTVVPRGASVSVWYCPACETRGHDVGSCPKLWKERGQAAKGSATVKAAFRAKVERLSKASSEARKVQRLRRVPEGEFRAAVAEKNALKAPFE